MWLMHYFSLFDKDETWLEYMHLGIHITGHVVLPMVNNGRNKEWWNLTAYFCILAEWGVFLRLCREMKMILKKQHHGKLHEIERTLESFFAECVAAFLVIFYVFCEAAGCVEDKTVDSCEPYFASARMFATTMSVPLVLYCAR